MKFKKILTVLASVMLVMCLWNMTASAEDGGMYYAPYYDEGTGTVVGAPEVGDWVPYGAVFSGTNIKEDETIWIYSYDTKEEAEEGYSCAANGIWYGEEYAPEVSGTYGDASEGWIVTKVYYDVYGEEDELDKNLVIEGYVLKLRDFINPIEVSINWDKIGYFRIGKELPTTADGFYTLKAENTGESCDGGFWVKLTEEHLEKGYISEFNYTDVMENNNGWASEYEFSENYVVSATDKICYNFDLHAIDGLFANSWDDVDISDNIDIITEGISLQEAYSYGYMGKGDVAEITVYLGTAEEIIEKAGIDNDAQYYGWKKIGDLWYYFDSNGNLVKNQWKKDSKGWCYLGEGGYMLTNEFVEDSKGYCYVGSDGYIVYNKWVQDEWDDWYYIGADGYKVTNKWVKDSKGWCYLGSWGNMYYEEWVEDSKGYCYVGEDGYMVTNQWVDSWEGLYYVDGSGYRVTNQWKKYDGQWVYLGQDGQVLTDQWVKDSVGWCYVDEYGFMVYDQWVEDSVGLCYVGSNGYMVTNKWVHDGYEWSYIGAKGYVLTDQWVKDSVGWCYVDEYGYMVRDSWVEDSKGYCYVGEDGYMVTNKWIHDGYEWSYIGANGYILTDQWVKDSIGWCYVDGEGYMMRDAWVADSKGWCYVDDSGYMVTNAWVETEGNTYYMNASGYRTVGWKEINEKWYYFDSEGVMARDQYIGDDYVDENGVWVTE